MSGYKLTYFNVTALGEPIRFLMSYGGIEFEDVRVEMEQWPEWKPKMPYGQMPILEFNGKVINQSVAITRYFAKQVKLAGNDDWEDLEIDAMVDNINDLRAKLAQYHYEPNPEVKESKKDSVFNDVVPFFLERFDKSVKENNGYLVLGRLTWADVYFVGLLHYLNYIVKKDFIEGYSNLEALRNKVLETKGIKEWVEKRPKTDL